MAEIKRSRSLSLKERNCFVQRINKKKVSRSSNLLVDYQNSLQSVLTLSWRLVLDLLLNLTRKMMPNFDTFWYFEQSIKSWGSICSDGSYCIKSAFPVIFSINTHFFFFSECLTAVRGVTRCHQVSPGVYQVFTRCLPGVTRCYQVSVVAELTVSMTPYIKLLLRNVL